MHPAEHRALRELFAFTRQLGRHWSGLAKLLGGDEAAALQAGAGAAGELLAELGPLTSARGLPTATMAKLAGRFASARPAVPDRALERNQALRFAALDAQHVVTLLGYVANLASADGDEELRSFCARWERKLRAHERAVRLAAVALGERPDEAIEPADGSAAGRAGAKLNSAVGAFGEWFDGSGLADRLRH
jgi:hypothetical protein